MIQHEHTQQLLRCVLAAVPSVSACCPARAAGWPWPPPAALVPPHTARLSSCFLLNGIDSPHLTHPTFSIDSSIDSFFPAGRMFKNCPNPLETLSKLCAGEAWMQLLALDRAAQTSSAVVLPQPAPLCADSTVLRLTVYLGCLESPCPLQVQPSPRCRSAHPSRRCVGRLTWPSCSPTCAPAVSADSAAAAAVAAQAGPVQGNAGSDWMLAMLLVLFGSGSVWGAAACAPDPAAAEALSHT